MAITARIISRLTIDAYRQWRLHFNCLENRVCVQCKHDNNWRRLIISIF